MILGSHNSWSYLRPKKWWMWLIAFTAKCQRKDIVQQYEQYGVRCFDLHIRFKDDGELEVVHGPIVYDCDSNSLNSLYRILNSYSNVYIRMILDVRTRKAMHRYNFQRSRFDGYCTGIEAIYPHIVFWCGRMVTGWAEDHKFKLNPTCLECYGSVTKHKWLWGIWPWLYAKLHTGEVIEKGTDKDILLVDFVDFQTS